MVLNSEAGYIILSAMSHKALCALEDGRVLTADPNRDDLGQRWIFEPAGEHYHIVSAGTKKALDVIYGGIENGAHIHQWQPLELDSQLWRVSGKDGVFHLISKHTDKCIDIVGISTQSGAHVQIWENLDGEGQRWLILPAETFDFAALPAKSAPQAEKKRPGRKPAAQKAAAEGKPVAKKAPAKKAAAEKKAPAEKKTPAKKPAAKKPAAKKSPKPAPNGGAPA